MADACSFDGCDRPKRSRGFCEAHYFQQRRGQPLRPLFFRRGCAFTGCNEPHSAQGWCRRHYAQAVNGRPVTVLGPPRKVYQPPRGLDALARLRSRARTEAAPYGLSTPCLLWQGAQSTNGYGNIHVGGRRWATHVLAYELAHPGERPAVVRHRCDRPACIEPDHLVGGNASDNVADRDRRGRTARLTGADRASAKLTWEQARAIRADERPYKAIAAEYGISKAAISMIRNGHTWKE